MKALELRPTAKQKARLMSGHACFEHNVHT
jgi:hypothetical protein